jgi:hypothetical protein
MTDLIRLSVHGYGGAQRLLVTNRSMSVLSDVQFSATGDGNAYSHFFSEMPRELAPGQSVQLAISSEIGPSLLAVTVTYRAVDGQSGSAFVTVNRF